MFKKINLFICSVLLLSPIMGYTESNGFYIGGQIGAAGVETKDSSVFNSLILNGVTQGPPINYSSFNNDTDTNFSGGLFVGYNFDAKTDLPIRIELNYTHRSKAKSSVSLETSMPKIGCVMARFLW